MTRRPWVWAVLAVYLLAAIALLVAPVSYSDIVIALWSWLRDGLGLEGFGAGWIEFASNVILFLPLGFLLTVLLDHPWWGACLAVGLSVGVEAAQILIPGRYASLRDILANALGAVIGALIAWLIIRRRRPARPTATTRAR
ncbi:VanZ family protein [Microbacterium memoriense]|uniref:VanZ family protein n=1 Tax=Microbacterium memoriense TaxID=2978350 RepID=A0ABT2PFJ4_9MICO|nr:VanZ family protein [Microbacterium memoriense]MCT9002638.1 VanZ family protein [Microbacterium memoriense]